MTKLTFHKGASFFFILSSIFILLKAAENEEYPNEIILKTKGPLFCENISDIYCYIKNYIFNISMNHNASDENGNNISIIKLKWDETITNASYLFSGCDNILEVDFNIRYLMERKTTDLKYMFANCHSLTKVNLFNISLNKDSSSCILYLDYMFFNCSKLNEINQFDIQFKFNGNGETSLIMENMFSYCISLRSANIHNIQFQAYSTGSLNMNNMFSRCSSLTSINMSKILSNKNGGTNQLYIKSMFSDCISLISVNIYDIYVAGHGKDHNSDLEMKNMFSGCTSLKSANISEIYLYGDSNFCYLYLDYMFHNCSFLLSVELSSKKSSKNYYMYLTKIFSGCTSLRYINMINFNYYSISNYLNSFDDVPNDIIYCINETKSPEIYNLLSQKNGSHYNCTYNLNNINKNKCEENLLFEYNNTCYENCPLRTYKKGFICHDCFNSCESCEQEGAEQSHNCNSCKEGYNLIYHIGDKNLNCYENVYDKDLIYNIHINECSTGYDFISNLLFCLDDCFKKKSINDCLEICNNFKYYFNNECLKKISTSFFEDKNYNYSCIINNSTNNICFFDDEYTFKKETIFYRILNIFDNINNIYIYFNADNYTIIEDKEYNYKYIIKANKNKQYKNDFNNININYTECKKNILKKYELSNEDCLYLLIIINTINETNEQILNEYEIHFFKDKLKINETCKFETKESKEACPKDFNFILTTNNKCVKQCNIQERENGICKSRYNTNNNETEETTINKTFIEEIQNEILVGIKDELINENFNTTNIEKGKDIVIEEKGTKFIITSSENQKNNIDNKNVTNIDLGKCETELKNKYNITGDLFILKIEKEIEGLKVPKIEYEVYSMFNSNKLEQLDLSICQGIKIDIYISFDLKREESDKYDINNGYYNNICYTYTTEDGIDISLSDRKNEYINNNMTLCEENCYFEKYDYEIGKVICSCLTKIKMPFISEISFDKNKIIEKFKDIKSLTNVNTLKCYYLLTSKEYILKNVGFFIICPVFVLHLISIFIFFFKEIKKIQQIISDIINNKKNIIKDKAKENPPLKKSKKNKKIKSNNNIITNVIHLGNKKQKKRKKIKKSKQMMETFFDSGRKINNALNPVTDLNNDNRNNNNIIEFTATELNLMPYENALEYDKRTYCQYYLNLVNTKNIVLFSFYLSNDYNSRLLKFNLFFNMFIIHLGINALFFTDSTMHRIYEDKGSFNFIYQIPQIIYSSLISTILNQIVKILSLTEKNILKLKSLEQNIDEESESIKKIIKIKFIFFFVFSFIILLFFGFYLSCFCAVYQNTQIHLIKDTLISFGTSILTPFVICLLPGLFRIPALKSTNKKYSYNLSKLLQMI